MRSIALLVLLAGCTRAAPSPTSAPVATVATSPTSPPKVAPTADEPAVEPPPPPRVCEAVRARQQNAPELETSCDGGDVHACYRLGLLLDESGDEHGAVDPLEKACAADKFSPQACQLRGLLLPDSEGAQTLRKGLFERACQGGDGEGCYLVGVQRWIDGDATATRSALARGCGNGSKRACGLLGWMQEAGESGPKELLQARGSLRGAGTGANFAACDRLARHRSSGFRSGEPACHMHGAECDAECSDDCARQAARGRRLFDPIDKACQKGRKLACLIGATVRAQGELEREVGEIVPPDTRRAFADFLSLCQGGLTAACGSAANFLHRGIERPVDLAQAAALYTRGCGGGDPDACLRLGQMIEAGEGQRKDFPAALVRYRQACQHGSLLTCRDLSEVYRTGAGVPADPRQAEIFAQAARAD
jgi:uncharacterized protein